MVQVIQPRDIGEEIGQAVGGGLGQIMQYKAQQSLVGDALTSALKEARENPEATPLDLYAGLAKSLAGIPGGMQMLGDTFQVVRQEMIREGARKKDRTDTEVAKEAIPRAPLSPEEQFQSLVQRNVENGMTLFEAQQVAAQQIQAETGIQQQKQEREKYAASQFNARLSEAFPEGDLDPALASTFRDRFLVQVNQGKSVEEAFTPLMHEYRAAQNEIGNLRELPQRAYFGSADDSIRQARQAIPKLIKLDPELALSMLQSELNLGEAESSEVVKPGSEKFKSFYKSFPKAYQEGLAKEKFVGMPKVKDNQEKRLKQFLKTSFNPETDSLLVLRSVASDGGIDDARFLAAVEEVYPNSSNNKNLSAFNRNEAAKLSQPATPGLAEIFRGLWEELVIPIGLRGFFTPETRTKPLTRVVERARGKR